MSDEKLEQLASRLSIADVSSAIAFGLQRALEAHGNAIRDRIIIYGGRLDFNIKVLPQTALGAIQDTADIGQT